MNSLGYGPDKQMPWSSSAALDDLGKGRRVKWFREGLGTIKMDFLKPATEPRTGAT